MATLQYIEATFHVETEDLNNSSDLLVFLLDNVVDASEINTYGDTITIMCSPLQVTQNWIKYKENEIQEKVKEYLFRKK